MPKVKSDLKKEQSEGRKEGWNGQLFGVESTESVAGVGFKDKAKAEETIKLLEGKDVTYQYHVINTMYNRAKVILKRTRDAEKVQNLTDAIHVFEEWINDYKGHSRHKENFGYLPIDVVTAYQKLAKHYKIKDNGFCKAYQEVDGDYKKLRNKSVEGSDVTWDVHRNRSVKPLADEIKKKNEAMYETCDLLNGLPSKVHTEIIMWGYSPDPTKVKKCISILEEKAKQL